MKINQQEDNFSSKSENSIRLLFGGDCSLDLEVRDQWFLGAHRLKEESENHPREFQYERDNKKPRTVSHRIISKLRRIWRSIKPQKQADSPFIELIVKKSENESRRQLDHLAMKTMRFKIDFSSATSRYSYPFAKIAPFFREKDFVLINLETCLAKDIRPHGLFISDPLYAHAMANAGISMVNLANNHIFDGGKDGFLQTIGHLKKAGILFTGAGKNFEDARLGTTVQLKNTKILFLGYTQYCNNRFSSVAAKYPGILPLDRQLIVEDVKEARDKADFIFVTLHWGIENKQDIHPKQREIAHSIINAGADGIIGHHPHVPQNVEVYKGKPIFYSLGNFIFGQDYTKWGVDNYLAELVIREKRIQEINIFPISGKGYELFQPYLLRNARANLLLGDLQKRSSRFDTKMKIKNNVGCIIME
jgi:poly-gamma-glutamate synthesis protein (capsule biosynthesis protein)